VVFSDPAKPRIEGGGVAEYSGMGRYEVVWRRGDGPSVAVLGAQVPIEKRVEVGAFGAVGRWQVSVGFGERIRSLKIIRPPLCDRLNEAR
jgi:hypothetical protein